MSGYEVEHIYDGNEAIKRLELKPVPNIILLDVRLPTVNGYEILKAVRSKVNWLKVPIYFLTADIRAMRPFRISTPNAFHPDGIIEKGAESIYKLRELFERFRQESDDK